MAKQEKNISPAVKMKRDALADRKSTRLNSSHGYISYAVFCLKKKKSQHAIVDGRTSDGLRRFQLVTCGGRGQSSGLGHLTHPDTDGWSKLSRCTSHHR